MYAAGTDSREWRRVPGWVRPRSECVERADGEVGVVEAAAAAREAVRVGSDRHHLLVRRSLSDPTDVAFFYAYVPAGRPATLPVLVAVAGRRWPVEEDFQVGKDQFGLDPQPGPALHATSS